MKDKIKTMLFGAFIFYVVLIVGLIIYNGSSYEDSFEIPSDDSSRTQKLNLYKEKLSTMDNNACNVFIKKLIDYYEKTDIKGKIKYSDYYKQTVNNDGDDYILVNYYEDAKKSCNLTDKEIDEYNFNYLFLTGSIQIDEIMEKYYYNYEINLRDNFSRLIAEPLLYRYEYDINRDSTLIIIKDLIEISEKGVFE